MLDIFKDLFLWWYEIVSTLHVNLPYRSAVILGALMGPLLDLILYE